MLRVGVEMKVLTIVSYDDAPLGQVTAVIACPDDCNEEMSNKLFCQWARKTCPSLGEYEDDEIVSDAQYAWNVCDVEVLP